MDLKLCERVQLSALAQLDDLTRKLNLGDVALEDYVIEIAKRARDMAQENEYTANECKSWKEKYKQLEQDLSTLERTLKNVRECYKREVALKEKAIKERNAVYDKIIQTREFLSDTNEFSHDQRAREKVLSCLDLHLQPVREVNESVGDGLSDAEFDVTDEILEEHKNVQLKRAKREDDNLPPAKKYREPLTSDLTKAFDEAINNIEMIDDPPREPEVKLQSAHKEETILGRGLGFSTSSPIIKPPSNPFNSASKLLERREHNLTRKKSFKTVEKCNACTAPIGFCTNVFRCQDCRAICHIHCKGKLPLPCIPYVSREGVGKKGRLITISDYAPRNSKPCIPALIIHCCTEIERRGLNEAGVYRIPGSSSEIKQWKEKILKSKNGVPNLSRVDIHVLCCVVKSFLQDLDEPLCTRVLWRDFADAAKIENPDDRQPFLCQAISELPIANRHTLAYLMLHFQRIAMNPACRMPTSNIAKLLGPTIVGYSSSEPITIALFAETHMQVKVMEALLALSSDYWENLLKDSPTDHFPISPLCETINKRQSIGSRVIGGSMQTEVLTPFKMTKTRRGHRGPLF